MSPGVRSEEVPPVLAIPPIYRHQRAVTEDDKFAQPNLRSFHSRTSTDPGVVPAWSGSNHSSSSLGVRERIAFFEDRVASLALAHGICPGSPSGTHGLDLGLGLSRSPDPGSIFFPGRSSMLSTPFSPLNPCLMSLQLVTKKPLLQGTGESGIFYICTCLALPVTSAETLLLKQLKQLGPSTCKYLEIVVCKSPLRYGQSLYCRPDSAMFSVTLVDGDRVPGYVQPVPSNHYPLNLITLRKNASYLSSSPVVPLSQPAQTVSSENVGLRATSALIQSVSEDLLRAHQQHEQEHPVEQSGYRPSRDMYSAFCNLMDRSRVADFLISDGDRALDEPAVVTTNSLQVKEVDRKTWVL
ncbi:hypothetical protein FRC18_001452 [Serendipita sp. 400]|nr:hypothetical protein FRC18_001452 [Serendipita sp. 400]